MNGPEFARLLKRLPPHPPVTTVYESRHRQGSQDERTSYSNQRDHMVGWMSEMNGSGAYGRKSRNRTAKAAYNSLRCAPALVWMAEALGEDAAVVRSAVSAADAAGPSISSQCGAIRKVVPWDRIEELIALQQPAQRSSRVGRFLDNAIKLRPAR